MYLLYLTSMYLTLPYILQTHSSQNTQAYFSCIFKLHVSQKYTYTRSMSNKVSTYNSYTYYKHHISQYIYIFLTISTHLKTYQILFQEHITKPLSHGGHMNINTKAFLLKGTNIKVILIEGIYF